MGAHEVIRVLDALDRAGVQVWLDGGWGVDALFDAQLRSHDDLDLVVGMSDVEKLQEVLAREGYVLRVGEAPSSFELVDPEGRQVDVHPVVLDEAGDGVYRMRTGEDWIYPASGFAGIGTVAERRVRCLTPEVQMLCHTGYELSEKDYEEIRALHERFGVDPPGATRSQ
jgi:lincosamide nucleotidyltransferase A/C/D/E